MEPDFLLNLFAQDRLQEKTGEVQLDLKTVRERFFNALKEIARLEKALEEKNTMLAISAREKDRLIHAVNRAFEDKKRLHDRLADFDVLRNMEIAELKQGIERITIERDHLFKESDALGEDLFKRDRTIDELRSEIDRKVLQLKDVQDDLLTAIETLRRTEARYKELEVSWKVIAMERDNLKERLNALINIQKLEGLSFSERETDKKEFIYLDNQRDAKISEQQSVIERLSEEINELNLRLIDSNKEIVRLKEENTEKNKGKGDLIDKITMLEKDVQLKDEDIATLRMLYDADTRKFLSKIEQLTTEKAEIDRGINEELERYKKSIEVSISEKEEIEVRLSEALGKVSSLEAKNAEYLGEQSSKAEIFSELRQQMESDILRYQATIEKLTSEKDDLNLKLREANRETISPKAPFGDIQFLTKDSTQPSTTLIDPLVRQYPSKMIYREPSRFEWIKRIAAKLR